MTLSSQGFAILCFAFQFRSLIAQLTKPLNRFNMWLLLLLLTAVSAQAPAPGRLILSFVQSEQVRKVCCIFQSFRLSSIDTCFL